MASQLAEKHQAADATRHVIPTDPDPELVEGEGERRNLQLSFCRVFKTHAFSTNPAVGLCQGTTLVVPQGARKSPGFSPCGKSYCR
jgi:hypothetical protein